uniref:Putative conjugal transfer protein TraT n=1 Tax=Pseudomonas fluorescens TaxID=294 RepID=A0A1W6C0M1_PSEFL|nr:HNH endonuclease [Pseudomonas fluorescens]ARJ57945.1 putative conjugal transfer protein TraT [Pseudomonas fluorescens]
MSSVDNQTDMVVPDASLGRNFERPALPGMTLSTKAQVWGDKEPGSMEPGKKLLSIELHAEVIRESKHRCYLCGFPSKSLEIHNLNHNHQDVRKENLRAVDALCHGWQHLGELGEGNAFIGYLPGLVAQDVNNLQRCILVALETGDDETKADAKKLLNWLASHRQYTEAAWGTFEPSVFASALVKMEGVGADVHGVVFRDLAVIFNPGTYSASAQKWAHDAYKSSPTASWPNLYHEIMNAPS